MTDTLLFKKGRDIDGRYRLNEVLARGGFGLVWSAKHLRTGQHVAIKVLDADRAALRDDAVERFLREATITASLRHPNTVRLFDVGGGEEGGPLYLVMERLYGPTLEQVLESLKRSQVVMSEVAAIDMALQVLGSLSEAHEAGLVHRDLKPSNLMLNEVPGDAPVVKVLDFGCIYIQGSQLTKAGNVYGTPGYMSPEQIAGDPVDCRTDLYALGVILYHCITGRGPFIAEQNLALMYQFTSKDPPDPRDVCDREISQLLAKVLLKALSRKQSERYQDAAEMRKALRAVRAAVRAAGHSTRPGGRKTMISGSYSPEPGETIASLVRITDENRLPHDRWARVPTESEPHGGDGGETTAYNIEDDELAAAGVSDQSAGRSAVGPEVTESSPSEISEPLVESDTDRKGASRAGEAGEKDLTPEDFKESDIAFTDVYRPAFQATSEPSPSELEADDAPGVLVESATEAGFAGDAPTTIDTSSAELRAAAAAAASTSQQTEAIDSAAFAVTPAPRSPVHDEVESQTIREVAAAAVVAREANTTNGGGARWFVAVAAVVLVVAIGAWMAGSGDGSNASLPVAGVANGAPPPPPAPVAKKPVAEPASADRAAAEPAAKPSDPNTVEAAPAANNPTPVAEPAAGAKPATDKAEKAPVAKPTVRKRTKRARRKAPVPSPQPAPAAAAPVLKPKIFDD